MLVCSVETFILYGDVVVIDNYIQNFDNMSPTQQWVQGWVMMGAILTPGNKKTNKNIVRKTDDILEAAQGINRNIDWSKINTYGMIKPKQHYQKHGVDEFIKNWYNPISPQQYFNDAKSLGDNAFKNMDNYNVSKTNITSMWGVEWYKIKDPKTGQWGIYWPNGEVITFWYY